MFDAKPDGWARLRLRDLFRERKEHGRDGLPIASVSIEAGLVLRSTLDRRVASALAHEDHALVRKNDIVYNMMRMWQGACGLAKSDCLVSPAYVVMTPSSAISPDFSLEMLRSPAIVKLLHAYSQGVVDDRLRLYPEAFGQIPVSIPPLDEQRRIAEVLQAADNQIAAQNAVVEKLRDLQWATFASFLRSGNACGRAEEISGWVTGRIDGISRLPPGWKITRLVDVARLESGHTPSRKVSSYWDEGNIGWISLHDTQSLERPEITSSEIMITEDGLRNSSARLLPAGTVCFSRTATVGKCVIMGRSMATSQDFANFICSKDLSNRYLLYLMRSMQSVWKQLSSGSTHQTIYMPTFESLQIVLPPRDAQDEIATAMDALTGSLESGLSALDRQRRLRAALVDELLSGRVRVPA